MKKISESYHDTTDLVEQLNVTVQYYNQTYGLNQGGCVFAAAVITKECENNHVPYQLAAYFDQDVNITDLSNLIESGELKHLSVIVDGTEIDGVSPQDMSHQGWEKETFTNFRSTDLMNLYKNGEWNGEWNPRRNDEFIKDIQELFMFTL